MKQASPRILVIGYDPDSVDYSDPGSPAGLDRDKVWAGAKESLQRIEDFGWDGTQCMVQTEKNAAIEAVELALSDKTYDCIVIGGGIRLSHRNVPTFEAIVNAIRRLAPMTPLAFNEGPETSLEAAQRWINRV